MAKVDQNWEAGPGGYQLINWGLERLAADPITNLFAGRQYYNTATGRIRTYNGATWDEYAAGTGNALTQAAASTAAGKLKVSAAADRTAQDSALTSTMIRLDATGVVVAATAGTDYLTADSTNTLTNKTFDANGTGNSITNIETADLASGVLNTSTTLASAADTQVPSALAVKTYVDSIVTGTFNDRGNWDASGNTFPNAGGSGTAGAIKKGDIWRVSVAGTLGGQAVQIGDSVRALQDAPAQVAGNWSIMQTNSEQASTTIVGLTRYSTDAEAIAATVTNVAVTPSNLATYVQSYAQDFGDGAALSFTITHSLGTKDVTVTVRDNASDTIRYPEIVATSVNTITIGAYLSAPAVNEFRVVVQG